MSDKETERRTAAFRREACFLLSNLSDEKNNGLFKCMEQQLGQKCLFLDNDREECVSLRFLEEAEEKLDMRVPPSFVHCIGCGSWLQPGHNGATVRLRSLGRSRTRRRRASRKKAARFREEQQRSIKGGRQWKGTEYDSGDQQEAIDLEQVRDGTCRNMIVYSCGSCGTKRKLKGLAAASCKKQDDKDNLLSQKRIATKDSRKQPMQKGRDLDSNADFIPVGRKRPPTATLTGQNQSLKPKKRKREKKLKQISGNKGSKKQLLDFLSSFNEP